MARLLTMLVFFCVGMTGCGGNNLHPVRGKVTFPDGAPLTEGRVVFQGTEGDRPASADGELQSDGTFELGSMQPKDGAPVGKYKVAVVMPFREVGFKRPIEIDKKYQNFDTSGLEFTVQEGKNDCPIQVTKPGAG